MIELIILIVIIIAWSLHCYRVNKRKKEEINTIYHIFRELSSNEKWENYLAQQDKDFYPLQRIINQVVPSLLQRLKTKSMTNQRYKEILEHVKNVLILVDKNGIVEDINKSAERLFQVRRLEVVGKTHWRIGRSSKLSELIQYVLENGNDITQDIQIEDQMMEVAIVTYSRKSQEKGIVVVLSDITERGRMERMRKEFVANVSHELKTPLTAIRGFSETLLAGAYQDTKTTKEFVSIINDEAERLEKLVNDLLELARIEHQDDLIVNFKPIDLSGIAKDVIRNMKIQAAEKNIEITLKIPDTAIEIMGDREQMIQVMVNLLSNAIKYTDQGGKVTISLYKERDKAIVSIKDSGIGISSEHLDRIFERFYRVDSSRQKISGGRGLGLSIVKHIVELHKGTISVKSVPGVGTEFILQFRQLS